MNSSADTPWTVLFGRMTWIILGPMALLLLTLAIVLRGDGWLTVVDAAFFLVLGLALLGRWLEFRGADPRTAYGDPATTDHLRRYLLAAPLVALVIWVAANLLGNHVLSS